MVSADDSAACARSDARVRLVEYAVSAGRGDWTVHLVVGLDTSGELHLLDCWRKQAATDESVDAFLDLVKQWRPIGWPVKKVSRERYRAVSDSRQRERRIYVAMEMFRPAAIKLFAVNQFAVD